MLSQQQQIDWLTLTRTEGIGPKTFAHLINRFGSAAEALRALPELTKIRGKTASIPSTKTMEEEFRGLQRIGGQLITWADPHYPAWLRQISSSPPVISVVGHLPTLKGKAVGLVGARNASAAGRTMAKQLAHELGEKGWIIVSGLARGIDAAAHEASLSTGTIAVIGSGLANIYPPEHKDLFQRIADKGLVISEMPLNHEARGRDFPRRNRIISGLSHGVIVVEATEKSGSLITAEFAAEQGRDVMAVPGSPLDPRCKGTNKLLREGAHVITCSRDALEVLEKRNETDPQLFLLERQNQPQINDNLWDEWTEWLPEKDHPKALPHIADHEWDAPTATTYKKELTREELLDALNLTPTDSESLASTLNTTIRELNIKLLDLENEGVITRLPGHLFVRSLSGYQR